MEDLVPFCPLCQTSFTEYYMQGFVLSCNHLVCQYCKFKLQYNNEFMRCYFDAAYTPLSAVRELHGLKDFLMAAYLHVAQTTLLTGATQMDEALRVQFNLNYDRAKIPCRSQNCPLVALKKCKYDHTRQYYKKSYCPYAETCPNYSSCIFVHAQDAQNTAVREMRVSSMPRPSELRSLPPPASPQDSARFYETIPEQRNYTLHFVAPPEQRNYTLHFVAPPESPTLPVPANPWYCPQCNQFHDPSYSACPFQM